ncbi:MAG: response regulator [Gammaproteobacteria bacterium]|nr:MAG: response regulator [Gammaproteobacteria bacterium]
MPAQFWTLTSRLCYHEPGPNPNLQDAKLLKRVLRRFTDNPLATRVWLWVLLFGSVLALVFTAVQLWLEYKEDVRQFELRINEVVESALPSLANSIWAVDERNIRSLLEGIRSAKGVYYVSLISADDRVYTSGESPVIKGVQTQTLSFPVVFNLPPEKWLGDLSVFLDPRDLYRRVWDRGLTILVSQSLKALLVAFFFLMVFRNLVSRHLEAMATYARERDLESLEAPLVLDRRESRRGDELSRVVDALNTMRERVREQAGRLREVETQMREEQARTREAHRTRSLYLANMTHDIRTPMNSVMGYSALLLEQALPDEVRQSVQIIHDSAAMLLERVNDILDLSRLEAGMVQTSEQAFEVRALIQEIIVNRMAEADEKDLLLDYQVDDGLPPCLLGDAGKIRHILDVFARNAVRYTDAGHVFIQAEFIEKESDGWRLRFSVEDTGPGLSRDELDVVFREFYRPYKASMDAGVGLSLSICRKLAELMGGRVGVASRPGEGATFWLEVTLRRAPITLVEPAPRVPEGFRVLLFDPHALSLKMTTQQLQNWQIEVIAAQSVDAFERELKGIAGGGAECHLIMLDSLAASANGGALIRQVRQFLGGHVPILVLSSHAHRGDVELYQRLGADGYLCKAHREASLAGVITRMMQGKEAFVTRFPPWSDPHGRRQEAVAGLKVLLVEDNPVNLMLARKLLEKCGCHVTEARTGQEALSKAASEKYDMVLLDCRLPDIDGPAVAGKIRAASGPNQDVAIFAVTANVSEEERARCLASGMNDFLPKPVRYEELCEVVRNAGLLSGSPSPATSV